MRESVEVRDVHHGMKLSYGSGLGLGWHSHRVSTLRVVFFVGDEGVGEVESGVYLNSRVESCLPAWPRELGLFPDLEGRRQ